MTLVNNTLIPTCADLAEYLKTFGDQPLFSGNGFIAVVGFHKTQDGVQVNIRRCPPYGIDAHASRKSIANNTDSDEIYSVK